MFNDITWKHVFVDSMAKAKDSLVIPDNVVAGAFDTETTGLHPVCDVPFLFQYGWYNSNNEGVVYIVDIERYRALALWVISKWNEVAAKLPIYLGHHVIFDLHMITNVGVPYTHYDNLSDTQYYIRAASDAIQTENGGEPLALKAWATRHINPDAADWEKDLKTERTQQAKELNDALLKATGWKKGQFNDFFKDKTNDYTDLPAPIRTAWEAWHKGLPDYLQPIVTGVVDSDDIRYDKLNREKVIEYGYRDIEYTLSCYYLCSRVVAARDNSLQVTLENEQIPVFYEMERVGFKVDVSYLQQSKERTKEYIRQRRHDLVVLAGQPLTAGQHAEIKKLLGSMCIQVEKTDAETLERVASDLKRTQPGHPAIDLIECILELRTLEKWYSTYICRFDRQLTKSDRIYTSIHQVETVSGRISCDFQQFPKAGLVSLSGEQLFDPRQMVIVDEEYPYFCYLDYSAQELRLQALFTYIVGSPDYNMMRAYAPWKCHLEDGTPYDCLNPEHRAHALDWNWLNDTDNQKWTPTDLHTAMTQTIFGDDIVNDPNFHNIRYVGKRCNFA